MRARSDPKPSMRMPVGCLYVMSGLGVFMFALFTAAAYAGLHYVTVRPLLAARAAQAWAPVPCEVLLSHVEGDGDVQALDFRYRYSVGGRSYESDRFLFSAFDLTIDGPEIVAAHPAGSRGTCRVDPANPAEAVFRADVDPSVWLGVLPGLAVLAGVSGFVGSATSLPVFARRVKAGAKPDVLPRAASVPVRPEPRPGFGARTMLRLREPRGQQAVVMWFVTLFWNGVTAVVGGGGLWALTAGPEASATTRFAGAPFLALFLTPFVLIGGALAYFAVRQTLLYIGPYAHVTAPGGVALGRTFEVGWEITGRIRRVRSMRMDLEGREEATYTQGTDRKTDTRVFARLPIFESRDPRALGSGRAAVTIPGDSMHSVAGRHNRIYWVLRVRADVPRWPDVDDDFLLEVGPRS